MTSHAYAPENQQALLLLRGCVTDKRPVEAREIKGGGGSKGRCRGQCDQEHGGRRTEIGRRSLGGIVTHSGGSGGDCQKEEPAQQD